MISFNEVDQCLIKLKLTVVLVAYDSCAWTSDVTKTTSVAKNRVSVRSISAKMKQNKKGKVIKS